jgi:hypothetical protein
MLTYVDKVLALLRKAHMKQVFIELYADVS